MKNLFLFLNIFKSYC